MTIPRYFTVPSRIWSHRGLNPTERMALATIDNLSDSDGRFTKGATRIACILAIPRSAAKEAIDTLKAKGLVVMSVDDRGDEVITISEGVHQENSSPKSEGNIGGADAIDYQEVLLKWKEICPMLPAPRAFTDKMKRQLRNLLKNNRSTVDELYRVFAAVACSDFLTGRVQSCHFRASLHWVLEDIKDRYQKILTGTYHHSDMERQALASVLMPNKTTETYYR